MGVIFGVAKISFHFWGVLEIPHIFWGRRVDAGPPPMYGEKMRAARGLRNFGQEVGGGVQVQMIIKICYLLCMIL